VPGDVIGYEEEYVEGQNVFLEEPAGLLRASTVGVLRLDNNLKVASVLPARTLRVPGKGSFVIGMVTQVRESLVFTELYGEISLDPRPRWVKEFSGRLTGVITPEHISDSRIDDIYSFLRPGDIIVARVMSTISPYLLSVKSPQLGVLYAFCSRCGSLMTPEADGFRCPRCGNFEKRKVSNLAYSRDAIKIDVKRIGLIPT
jgi:exosome complex component CSL4